jgi:uncharacterized lipoprotein YddW (UPF0748 family)
MNTFALKQLEITQQISLLSEQQLEQINQYLKTVFTQPSQHNKSLKGIWKDKGFEQFNERAELKQIRQELNQSILQKII